MPGVGIGASVVTAKAGAGQQMTAVTFRNINLIEWNLAGKVIKYFSTNSASPGYQEFDYAGAATVTVSVTGDLTTITVS